jgi:protocatechuate 3,4-dioxygenase beta subunit
MSSPPARTDADGAFRVTGLTQDVAEVSARAWVDPAGAPAENVEVGGAKRRAIAARGTPWSGSAEKVAVGTTDLVITLTKGDALRGRVVDSSGKPVERFTVIAEPDWDSASCENDLSEVHHSYRDKDGRFELDGLKKCTWSVHAHAQGLLDSPEMKVEMPGAKHIEIVMLRNAQVTGVVLGPDKKPVVGARVICTEDTGGWDPDRTSVRSDKKGEFVVKSAPIGPVRIFAHAEGLADSAPVRMDLGPAAAPARMELVLRAGATVVGKISEPPGEAQRSYTVALVSTEGTMDTLPKTTRTDAEGGFRFTAITPGRFHVQARDTRSTDSEPTDSTRVLTTKVDLRDGETTRVELGAKIERIRVHGKVITTSRVAKFALTVKRVDDRYGSQQETFIADDATYELTVGLPGDYVFGIGSGDSSGGRFRVHVPAVKDFEHDLELPSGSVFGRVVDAEGEPLKDVRVRLFDAQPRLADDDASRRDTSTGDDGKFEFEYVPAGTWSLGADYSRGGSFMPWDSGASLPGRASRGGVVVKDGERTGSIELVLTTGSRLTGIARNPAGAPLPGVDVFAFGADGHVLTVKGKRCDNSGRYEIEDAPAGRVLLYAHTMTGAGTASVDVRSEGETVCDVTLGPAGDLDVSVHDASGAPTWAALELVDADGRHLEEMEDMHFDEGVQTWTGLPVGRFTVRAHVDGAVRAEKAARVSAGQRTQIVLTLDG